MAQVIYTKYNRLRRPEYRVRTCICEENGERWVEKQPLCPEAVPHVLAMADMGDRLKQVYSTLDFVKAEPSGDGVRFEYVKGETADSILARIETADGLRKAFKEIFRRVLPDIGTVIVSGMNNPDFNRVFGKVKNVLGAPASVLSNLDCLLDNIIVDGDHMTCLDYEWVFDFPVHYNFLRYRIVHYFYQAHPEKAKLVSGQSILEDYGFDSMDFAIFGAMELEFQRYVYGKDQDECRYTENYRKPVTTYDEMIREREKNLREINALRGVVSHYESIEKKLRKIGLWQTMQGAQEFARECRDIVYEIEDKMKMR